MTADTQNHIENDVIPIIRLDPARQREAADLLARAFFADPLMVHYLPDPAQRARLLPGFMRASLRYCLFYGEVWTTPDLAGAACWLGPGQTEMKLTGLIRAAWGVVSIRMGWRALRRVQSTEAEVDRLHHTVMPGPHWYLLVVGVDPQQQGRGIGTRLLAPQLERAAAAGLPIYLETMTERDVAFYRKNGFSVGGELTLASGLRVWAMIR
jgi:GNAT superfamily N-acetyltransferase